jgi:amino acid transporter/SAM-dependent methyltransferase
MEASVRTAGLVRGLRRWDLVALVINLIIGAGIFGLPSRVFALAGTYSLLSYVEAATAIVLIILCFAEVGSRFTATGVSYLYSRAAFGPLIGFQVGWLLWLGRIAGSAALCNLFVAYLGHFVPTVNADPWRSVAIVATFAALASTNIIGVQVTTAVTNALTLGKLIPLFFFIVVGLFFVEPQRYSLATPPAYGSFSHAALLLVFAYTGFEGAAIPSGEMRDPARHLPFALLTGLAVVVLVYVLVQTVCIGTLPDLAHSERPLSDASLRFLGAPGASLIAAGAMVSIGGALNAQIFATPRLLFAMAENRQLPHMFSTTHVRFRTPIAAIALTSIVALTLSLATTFISALTIGAIVRLGVYMITCAALPVLRRDPRVPRAAFVAPAGPLVSAVAVVLSIWLLSNSPWSEMRLAGMAVVMGFVLYLPCVRWPSRDARASRCSLMTGDQMSEPGVDRLPRPAYYLGDSDRELDRLKTQARVVDPITRRFFRDAGIVPGMRVLDVGSGAGDVTFLVADLVGDSGEVVGVDRAPNALAKAQARAEAQSRRNVFFREGDPAQMSFDRPFDAVVGRYVLQFQPDPTAMLRKLSLQVKRGGLIVFHEVDWEGVRSFPPSPTYEQCCRWILETLRLMNVETRMGIKLHTMFLAAGLRAPTMRLEAVVGGPSSVSDRLYMLANQVETMAPEMERLGVVTAATIALETLAKRMNDEIHAESSVIVGRSEIGAWCHV